MNGIPVEFMKIAPGGFIVIDIDGSQKLISRQRWDELPRWASSTAPVHVDRPRPTQDALVLALVGVVLWICEISAWLIRRAISVYAAIERRVKARLGAALSVACLAWPSCLMLCGWQ
jgi:hypothetical protein